MSDEKIVKPKRAVSPPKSVPEPAVPVPETSEPATMLPKPDAIAALPVPSPRPEKAGASKLIDTYQAALASIGKSQTAIASDVTALALEMSGLASSNLTAAGDSVTALLRARSFADAVEIQLSFARRSLEAIVDGSTRLGEIGLRLTNNASKPMLEPFVAG